jgi:hypothetical protein
MEEDLLIHPYISIGNIKFGMNEEEVKLLFNKNPDIVLHDYLKRTDARWDNISVKFDKKGLANEVSFIKGRYRAFFDDIDLFNDNNTIKTLNKIEKPLNTVGFKVYFKIGIALTGFGKNKEEKTISIFSKELIKIWKA